MIRGLHRPSGTTLSIISRGVTMRHLLDTAELLIASWILGGDDDRIPTSPGILDQALEIAVEDEACPPWVRDQLHFVDSRIGLQCVELPALLDWGATGAAHERTEPLLPFDSGANQPQGGSTTATGPRRDGAGSYRLGQSTPAGHRGREQFDDRRRRSGNRRVLSRSIAARPDGLPFDFLRAVDKESRN